MLDDAYIAKVLHTMLLISCLRSIYTINTMQNAHVCKRKILPCSHYDRKYAHSEWHENKFIDLNMGKLGLLSYLRAHFDCGFAVITSAETSQNKAFLKTAFTFHKWQKSGVYTLDFHYSKAIKLPFQRSNLFFKLWMNVLESLFWNMHGTNQVNDICCGAHLIHDSNYNACQAWIGGKLSRHALAPMRLRRTYYWTSTIASEQVQRRDSWAFKQRLGEFFFFVCVNHTIGRTRCIWY